MNPYDEDRAALVQLEQLHKRNPKLARAARIIAADPKQAANLFISLPKAVYPYAIRALLTEMGEDEQAALVVVLDDPEVKSVLS